LVRMEQGIVKEQTGFTYEAFESALGTLRNRA
jgi:hypothetical protein